MKDVVIYTTNSCPWCRRAEQFLTERGVPFENVDVTGDTAMRAKLIGMAGGRRTVPQIFIGGQPIGGFTDMEALDDRGELEPMLKGPSAV